MKNSTVFDRIKVSYKWDNSKTDVYKVCIKYMGKQYTFSFYARLVANLNKFMFIKSLINDYFFYVNDDYLLIETTAKQIEHLEKNYIKMNNMFDYEEFDELKDYVCGSIDKEKNLTNPETVL